MRLQELIARLSLELALHGNITARTGGTEGDLIEKIWFSDHYEEHVVLGGW